MYNDLSERARNYIQKLTRSKSGLYRRGTLESFFRLKEIPVFEPVVDFGVRFSGYNFTLAGKPSESFEASLLEVMDMEIPSRFDVVEAGDRVLFYCGQHSTAQYYFFIDDLGRICTFNDEEQNITHTSFAKVAEQYALIESLSTWLEHPYFYNIENAHAFNKLINDFEIIPESSDDYNTWYRGLDVIVWKGIWLHAPTSFLHFYAQSTYALVDFLEALEERNIVNPK